MIAYRDAELCCDGHSLTDLANRFGTPFFLFSERQATNTYERLLEAFRRFPSGCRVDYAVKTNYELAILRLFSAMGAGAMVSSEWELRLALSAGFPAARITFQGPCKSGRELQVATAAGVRLFHACSVAEVEQLERTAAGQRRRIGIFLRLALPSAWRHRGLIGWYAGRLGIRPQEAEEAWRKASSSPWIYPIGVSTYVGTQVRRPGPYLEALKHQIRIAERLQTTGEPVQELVLGGGWPSETLEPVNVNTLLRRAVRPELPPDTDLLSRLAGYVAVSLRRELEKSKLVRPPLLRLECGRSLIGPAGLLLTRVLALRSRWVFVDASRNLLPESSLVGERHVLALDRRSRVASRHYHLAGRTVNTMDVFALWAKLPPLQVGDGLVFLDAGAYSLSRANRYAASIPAAYLVTRHGEVKQIRRADRYDDITAAMAGQRTPVDRTARRS
jgi:diaminopimelate decarboxylase